MKAERFDPYSRELGTSASWQRADPRRALVESVDAVTWKVYLGGDVHECRLFRDSGLLFGDCRCRGWTYHSRCAHVATIWKAARCDRDDLRGNPVEIFELNRTTRSFQDSR